MGSKAGRATDSKIASCLQAIPQVEAVYVFHGEAQELRIMTVVDQENDNVYEDIYRQELQMAKSFPSIQFDFNVVARRGRNVSSIMGNSVPAWVRPASECPQLQSI